MPNCEMCGLISDRLFPMDIVTKVTDIVSTPEGIRIFEIHSNKMICQHCLDMLYELSEQIQLFGEIIIYDCSIPE